MKPLPETRVAAHALFASRGGEFLAELLASADRVRDVVPSLVGVSLTALRDGLTFTVVATSAEIAEIDAVQYLDGGPCVTGATTATTRSTEAVDHLDEGEWRAFAHATAARGIACSLTLPIIEDGTSVGSVNLYAAQPDAFETHHEDVAAVFAAWAGGAVTNADLPFSTREAAMSTPALLRDQAVVDQAVSVLVAARETTAEHARAWLRDAAQRAGVPDVHVARAIIDAFTPSDGETDPDPDPGPSPS
ncbi:ANTAR domain-containing protein [Nocardioides litoris]|uniref:ANTAR domain-containing protein n=1 Tax=Nocardioides litoris TaxID=1926648 RepID=UPI00147681D1|nr:ANTAR domain-containing protein [Nocardioides litoris]